MEKQIELQGQIFSEREYFEGMDIRSLLDSREMLLEAMSEAERRIHLINDVLSGYGYEEEPQ